MHHEGAAAFEVGEGVVVVPALETYLCRVDGPFVCLLSDRWMWPEPPRGAEVAAPAVGAVVAAARRRSADQAGTEGLVTALVDWNGPVGPRAEVARALEEMRRTDDLATPARALGQTAAHVRRRVRHEVGCAPGTVRRWMRLARAYAAVGEQTTVSASGEGEFADQAHFTRGSSALAGRTSGSVHPHR